MGEGEYGKQPAQPGEQGPLPLCPIDGPGSVPRSVPSEEPRPRLARSREGARRGRCRAQARSRRSSGSGRGRAVPPRRGGTRGRHGELLFMPPRCWMEARQNTPAELNLFHFSSKGVLYWQPSSSRTLGSSKTQFWSRWWYLGSAFFH